MTPPLAPQSGSNANTGAALAVSSFQTSVLKNRAEFLRAAKGQRLVMRGFLIQGRKRDEDEPSPTEIRVGFICSKKVGNAVARNRAKRRLREIARLIIPHYGAAGWDYVLIGRAGKTARHPFDQMQADLMQCLNTFHGPRR